MSTADDFLAFARFLLAKGRHQGKQLLSLRLGVQLNISQKRQGAPDPRPSLAAATEIAPPGPPAARRVGTQ